MYAGSEPPAGYMLSHEVEGVLRASQDAGFERFHLVGFSAGGAASLAVAEACPERLLSLALIEPAWMGNDGLSHRSVRCVESSSGSPNCPRRNGCRPSGRTSSYPGWSHHPRRTHRRHGCSRAPSGCKRSRGHLAHRLWTSKGCALSDDRSISRSVVEATSATTNRWPSERRASSPTSPSTCSRSAHTSTHHIRLSPRALHVRCGPIGREPPASASGPTAARFELVTRRRLNNAPFLQGLVACGVAMRVRCTRRLPWDRRRSRDHSCRSH